MSNDEVVSRLTDAMVTVASGLDLPSVLQQIAEAAATLLDARYAALGVIGDDGGLVEFVHTGFDGDIDKIGHLPKGHGILGLLIHDARPLRLDDLTTHPRSVGFPDGHPMMRSFLGVPIRARDQVYGNLYVTEKGDGSTFTEREEQLAIALGAVAGAAVNNALHYGATRRREQSLDALREISGEILSGADDEQVLDLVADHARELVDGMLALISVPHRLDDTLVVRAAAGPAARDLAGSQLPAKGSLAAAVMQEGCAIVTDQVPAELIDALAGTRDTSVVGVPMLVRGEPYGALVVASDHLADDHLRLIETFGNHASVVIEYSRARHELERLLLIEERERIGRDLHDSVIQRLFATGLELQALAARRERSDGELAAILSNAVDGLDDTISQIRATIFALQPPQLSDTAGEVTAAELHRLVANIVAESARALGFRPQLVLPNKPDATVPRDVAAHMLVVLREGLSNVARHASATEATVEIELDDGFVARVTDNGVGLPPEVPIGGNGLVNMRRRAEAVGGQFAINEAREGGTILEWRVRSL